MMASLMDRGDAYRVEYLGCSMLTHMATGLGVLQKPLRQLYFQHCQREGDKRHMERHLVMTASGMTMSHTTGETSGGGTENTHYPMSCVLYWDAVRFVTVGPSAKKMRGAFEPLDNDHSRNKDNLFQPLDKNMACLRQMTHPAMFACVLRRTVGLKALDVHAFICASERCALGLVRALNAAQVRHVSNEKGATGVFGYTPFARDVSSAPAGPVRSPAPAAAAPPARRSPGRSASMQATSSHPHAKVYQLSQDYFAADGPPQRSPPSLPELPDDHMYQCLILNDSQLNTGTRDTHPPTSNKSPKRLEAAKESTSSPVTSRPTHFSSNSPVSYANSLRQVQERLASGHHGRDRRLSKREMGSLAARAHFGSNSAIDQRRADSNRYSPVANRASLQKTKPPIDLPPRGTTPTDLPARPIAMVQPHKVQGIRVLPAGPSAPRIKSPQQGGDSLPPPRPASGGFPGAGGAFRDPAPRRTQSQYFKAESDNAVPIRLSPARISRPPKGSNAGDKPTHRPTEQSLSTEKHLLLTQKKDAEIAGLVKNMRINYEPQTAARGGTNFEKSLGYFP